MLPRKLIINWPISVYEALQLRGPISAELNEAIEKVCQLGKLSSELLVRLEDARRLLNEAAKSFTKVNAQQKIILRDKAKELKEKIKQLETEYNTVESNCAHYESIIPNIPDPDCPMGSYYEEDNPLLWAEMRCLLRLLHCKINDYNGQYDWLDHE